LQLSLFNPQDPKTLIMNRISRFLVVIICVLNCSLVYAQDSDTAGIILTEAPLANKHRYAVWRTDYYVCTGIAYAKSMGQTVEDFAEFVAARHNLTGPNDTSLIAAVKSANFVMTCYPNGKFEIVSESDNQVVTKFNRPYKGFFRNGPVLGVTIDEFEKYMYGHVVLMAAKISLHCDYKINNEEVVMTFTTMK
jgi:hypothetical protein